MNTIEEAIRMWEIYREGTVGEVSNIAEDKMDYRVGDGARTVRELVVHIVASSHGFTEELLSDDTQFMRLRNVQVQADLMAQFSDATSKEQLVELLVRTGADNARRLREAAEKLATRTMTSMTGEQSRLAGIWFAAAHEMYHRGQLATYARSLGLVPAMTQRIAAMSQQMPPK